MTARSVAESTTATVCRHKISIVTWPEAARRPHPMVYDFVTNIYTRPELGKHVLVGGLDDSTEALACVS